MSQAVSVSLPQWTDTLGWANRDSRVMEKLQTGYPRFYVPHLVRMLEEVVMKLLDYSTCTSEEFGVKLFPASAMAQACRTYLLKKSDEAALICVSSVTSDGVRHWTDLPVHTVMYPNTMKKDALAFWQHTGYGISSRCAQFWLARSISRGEVSIPQQEAKAAAVSIRRRIANLYSHEIHHVPAEDVSLYQSGMSAISQIALAMSLWKSDRVFRVAVFG
jgi:cystathionine gamma-synthase